MNRRNLFKRAIAAAAALVIPVQFRCSEVVAEDLWWSLLPADGSDHDYEFRGAVKLSGEAGYKQALAAFMKSEPEWRQPLPGMRRTLVEFEAGHQPRVWRFFMLDKPISP